MLMDNMGSGGGSSEKASVFGGSENTAPMGEVVDFEEFVKQREDLKPQMELPPELAESAEATVGEKASEMQAQGMPTPIPAAPPKDEPKSIEDEVKAELASIDIKRDAEVLPKAYMQAVTKIVNRDKKDPHKLLAELDVARWDMMSKAFGRNRGDGLNGKI